MKKVLVIAGPTASGKTRLSIELAKRYGCSIISGDSIQVYKGFDIGSGKITEIRVLAGSDSEPHSGSESEPDSGSESRTGDLKGTK